MCLCVCGRGMSTGETRCRKSQTAEKKKKKKGETGRGRRIFAAHLTGIFQHILTRLTCGIPPIALHDIINGLFIKLVKGNQCNERVRRISIA